MSTSLKNQSALSQDQEADLLISALHAWGIDYLIASSQSAAMKRVELLVQQKLITLDELDAAYQEILPRMGKRPYINLDPQKFAERYRIVRQQLQQGS